MNKLELILVNMLSKEELFVSTDDHTHKDFIF